MKYTARIDIPSESFCLEDTTVSIEKEGITFGNRSIDYSVFSLLRPINHAVFITLMDGTEVKVSMLGFSFDGFWEEIIQCFGDRTEAALFIEEEKLMDCEGEYDIPGNSILPRSAGRGRIRLYTDAVCILPQDSHAVRIPLCYAESITLEGYLIQITMRTGEVYTVGRMGYDTQPFHERCVKQMEKTKKQRAAHIAELRPEGLFTEKGLFRTAEETSYWLAAYSEKCCAVELFTGQAICSLRELEARADVRWQTYSTKVLIEARMAARMALNHVLPAGLAYQRKLLENLDLMRQNFPGEYMVMGATQIGLIKECSEIIDSIRSRAGELDRAREKAEALEEAYPKAIAAEKAASALMCLRESIDALEEITDNAIWPLPKYRELLFIS